MIEHALAGFILTGIACLTIGFVLGELIAVASSDQTVYLSRQLDGDDQ
jgi:hypothetical protein